ncbi:MAG: NTP transferase domain-containing protein [Muribaculaceae bacterium]|nr:NTP transferase domain-containing protein [Muribaculaceae bacterium]
MNAFILAAGLGTRLKPWTLTHPKALVPVGGVPMLERVVLKLKSQGFDNIVVNVHHFASQIVDFLKGKDYGVRVSVSDETGRLLDTGGGLVKARGLFDFSCGPVLVHNVDILSDADLGRLMGRHCSGGQDATLLVSLRESGRKLVFGEGMELCGWHNLSDGRYRPSGFVPGSGCREYAFSGIHVVGEKCFWEMSCLFGDIAFPVMDYYLNPSRECVVRGSLEKSLRLIDIGKPATLLQADKMF